MDHTYSLEIYEPDSARDVAAVFFSDAPFMLPAIGHLLHPAFLTTSAASSPEMLLRVVSIQHIPWQHEKQPLPKQKVYIFTEAVPNEPGTLLPQRKTR